MTITINTEKMAISEKTFRECLYKAAIAEPNGNVRLEVKVANSVHKKCYGKTASIIVQKLVSLNPNVLDDNYDTYTTENTEIIQLSFLDASLIT
jgi:hypothetical protein